MALPELVKQSFASMTSLDGWYFPWTNSWQIVNIFTYSCGNEGKMNQWRDTILYANMKLCTVYLNKQYTNTYISWINIDII